MDKRTMAEGKEGRHEYLLPLKGHIRVKKGGWEHIARVGFDDDSEK